MKRTLIANIIINVAAYLLALVFISVGASKLMGYHDFVVVLKESPFVKHFIPLIALPIPILEVIVGLALLIPLTRRYGFIVSLMLMVVFTLYNIYLLLFAPDVPCGCGGIFKDMSWTAHLFVNIGLTILAWVGIYLSADDNSLRTTFSTWKSPYIHFKKRRSIGTE